MILNYHSGAITGEVDVILTPGMQMQEVHPVSFDFGGLLTSGTQLYGGGINPIATFDFSTDAQGFITQWDMRVSTDMGGGYWANDQITSNISTGDTWQRYSERGNCDQYSAYCTREIDTSVQGHWTGEFSQITAPEINACTGPSMILILIMFILIIRGKQTS